MWHPPDRVRHPLPIATWPSQDDAAHSRLFSAVRIGEHTAAQRTWVPAMVPWRATDEGFVTKDVIAWYSRFAAGKPGVLVVEASGIRDIPSGPLLRISHQRFIEGLSQLTRAVKEASSGETLVFIQLIDFLRIRRRPEKEKFFARFLEITDSHRDALVKIRNDDSWTHASEKQLRSELATLNEETLATVLSKRELEDLLFGHRERVWDTQLDHIRELPQVLPNLFADAAERAFAAGFDGVELHYAHAYTMASFLSALNTRTDGYGGPRQNRVRLPLEVIAAVRERVGSGPTVGLRFLGDDVIEGGNRIEDATFFATQFAKANVDFLSVSKGGKFEDAKKPKIGRTTYPYTGQSGYECMPTVWSDKVGPFARNVGLAAAVRQAVRSTGSTIPVVTAGGICTFEQAEAILAHHEADIVASARQTLADPDWFVKMKSGRGNEIRRCEYTNYCEGLDQNHKQVTCKLWDRLALDEPGVSLDSSGRRRLIAPRWDPLDLDNTSDDKLSTTEQDQ